MDVGLGPGTLCQMGTQLPPKGAQQPRPHFSSDFAPVQSPISAMAQLASVDCMVVTYFQVGIRSCI